MGVEEFDPVAGGFGDEEGAVDAAVLDCRGRKAVVRADAVRCLDVVDHQVEGRVTRLGVGEDARYARLRVLILQQYEVGAAA